MMLFRNSQGVTLIELVIVVAIILIILSIAMPKSDSLLNYRERRELMGFKKDIVFARNNAIFESTLYRLDIRPKENYYIIYKLSDKWEKVKRKNLESGLKFEFDYLNRIEVIFNPTGAPNKGISIYLISRKEEKIRITITPATGKVNIYVDGDKVVR